MARAYSSSVNIHLLAALDAESDVTVVVTDGYEGLEPGPLTSSGLLLHRHNLQNFVLKGFKLKG